MPGCPIIAPSSSKFSLEFPGSQRENRTKLMSILKEMGTPEHLTCLPRNLYADQEATVRTRHGTMDKFKNWKGVHQSCILLPCLFKT